MFRSQTLPGEAGSGPGVHSGPVRYREPSPAILSLIDAEPFPSLLLSPRRDRLALARRPRHPSIEDLARAELRLAGLRIDPARHDQSRRERVTGLSLVSLDTLEEQPIEGLPERPLLSDVSFSPDGSHLAFVHAEGDRLELWIVEVESARARVCRAGALSGVVGAPHRWLPDGSGLICRIVPDSLGAPPVTPPVPIGPIVLENDGRRAPSRTFTDLLEGPHDEALFEHYLTSELVRVSLEGDLSPIAPADLHAAVAPSPDGRYLRVETIRRPFSYRVPAGRFPVRVEVRDLSGRVNAVIAELPLADAVPTTFGSVRTGRRWFAWRADSGCELAFVEAQDGGDAAREAEVRDRLYLLREPFDGEPREVAALSTRFGGVSWGDERNALVSEWWWPTRRERTWHVAPGAKNASEALRSPEPIVDRNWEDRYSDPGVPVMRPNGRGGSVLLLDRTSVFLNGDGASSDGDHPFLDRFDLDTRERTRIWRSSPPGYRRVMTIIDATDPIVLMRHEDPENPPNYTMTKLGPGRGAGRAITRFTHPAPELRAATKSLLRYERADGVELSATLHLPPGHDPGRDGALPLLVWAYPRGFKSTGTAEQVTAAPHRWEPIWWSSPLVWLTQGYAVLDDPSMPIIGEGDVEPNDTYVEQLVMNAEAAVEAVVSRGIVDRARIAVAGHSYGAFMTAHLLAHTDLFQAGIARSGSYNRTLTPFGFQSEERHLWDAPEVYTRMSTFNCADRIRAPLLLIHGQADDNAGTYPEQSERFFDALKGLGKTVRLVLLPHESHGYRARESVLHVLQEMSSWLETHIGRGRDEPSAIGASSPRSQI